MAFIKILIFMGLNLIDLAEQVILSENIRFDKSKIFERRPYDCKANEKPKVNRFISFDYESLAIILDNQVIIFPLPTLKKIKNKSTQLIIKSPVFVKYHQLNRKVRIIGYEASCIMEKCNTKNRILWEYFVLPEDEGKAKFTRNQLSNYPVPGVYESTNQDFNGKIDYTQTYGFNLVYTTQNNGSKIFNELIRYDNNNQICKNELSFLNSTSNFLYPLTSTVLDYKVRYATMTFAPIEKNFKDYIIYKGFLAELDFNQNIYLYNFIHNEYNKSNFLNRDTWLKSQIKLESLLNCRKKIQYSSQVKGIYYNKKHRLFYIFIERFYLKRSEDLVKYRFLIEDSYYEEGQPIKFTNETVRSQVEFAYPMKWVKNLGNKVFFFFFNRGYIFENKNNLNKQDLILKPDTLNENKDLSKLIKDCIGQTLMITINIYCFESTLYSLIGYINQKKNDKPINVKFKIENIFKETSLDYKKDEILEFIFNYKDNNFVMMTRHNLYLIDYRRIRIDKETAELTIKLLDETDKNLVYKIKNCLFPEAKCEQLISNEKIIFILFLVFAIPMIIVLIIFIYFQKRRRKYITSKVRRKLKKCKQKERKIKVNNIEKKEKKYQPQRLVNENEFPTIPSDVNVILKNEKFVSEYLPKLKSKRISFNAILNQVSIKLTDDSHKVCLKDNLNNIKSSLKVIKSNSFKTITKTGSGISYDSSITSID